jgi:hypothetical protein
MNSRRFMFALIQSPRRRGLLHRTKFLHTAPKADLRRVEGALRVNRDVVHPLKLAGLAPVTAPLREHLSILARKRVDLAIGAVGDEDELLLRIDRQHQVPDRAVGERLRFDPEFLHEGAILAEHLDAVVDTVADIDEPVVPSRDLNPSLSEATIAREYEKDAASAAAEYGAQFRSDIEAFITLETVQRCVGDYVELMPVPKYHYHAFTDPSGGSADSFTLAIAHKEGEQVVIDALREVKPPFSPEATINDFTILLKQYRINRVSGDKYAGEFPRELFRRRGITYWTADKSKSDLYRDLLPALNSGRILLPRNERLTNQLVGLERRTTRAGRDSIDHAPGGHDDIANVVAGAHDIVAEELARFPRAILSNYEGSAFWFQDDEISPEEWERAQKNIDAGSALSNIAKDSDVPSDFTMRVTGLDPYAGIEEAVVVVDEYIQPPKYDLYNNGPTQSELQAQEKAANRR